MTTPRRTPVAKNDLEVGEITAVAIVPAGDNPDALVTLAKARRNPEHASEADALGDMSANPPITGAPAGDGGAAEETELAKFIAALQEQNQLLAAQNDALVKALAEDDDEDYDDDFEDEDDAPVRKHAVHDEDDEDDEDYGDDVEKFLKSNPVAAAIFQAQQDEIAKLREQTEIEARIAKAEREARYDVEFAKRADALSALGTPKDEMAKGLRRLFDQVDNDTYLWVEKHLAHAATVIEESDLTKEIGTADQGGPASKLDELLAKAATPRDGLSQAEALVAAFAENDDLYRSFYTNAGSSNGVVQR